MNNCKFLLLLLLCFLVSCNSDEIEDNMENVVYDIDFGVPYEDTSIFLMNHSNESLSTIQIGSQQFNVPQYNVFPKGEDFLPVYRFPMVSYTDKETILVAGSNQESGADFGLMNILLARKEKNSDNWEIKQIFQTDSVKGRPMCPALVVDRISGRIYLFINYFKNIYVLGTEHSNKDVEQLYKYSDDDGKTWSKEYSLKPCWGAFYSLSGLSNSLWYNTNENTNNYSINDNIICVSSGPSGISLENGVLLIPSYIKVNEAFYSLLLIRENGMWHLSQPTPFSGDNECTVYLDNMNRIVLDCRTITNARRKYYYNLSRNEFTEISSSVIDSYMSVSTEIINDDGLFYMCYPDGDNNNRKDISFYGSKDGINWNKIFLINPGSTYGYTAIEFSNNKLFVSYEAPDGIYVQDFSSCRDAIRTTILNNR